MNMPNYDARHNIWKSHKENRVNILRGVKDDPHMVNLSNLTAPTMIGLRKKSDSSRERVLPQLMMPQVKLQMPNLTTMNQLTPYLPFGREYVEVNGIPSEIYLA